MNRIPFAALCRTFAFVLLFAGFGAIAGEGTAPGERAAPPAVAIYYFRAEGCPHCAHAGAFLKRYAADARITIRDYEVNNDTLGREYFIKVVEALGVRDPGVPFIIVGDWAVIGYQNDESTGVTIGAQVARCLEQACPDSEVAILADNPVPSPIRVDEGGLLPETFKLPLVGEVATATLSLPVLTIVWAPSSDSILAPCGR